MNGERGFRIMGSVTFAAFLFPWSRSKGRRPLI
jgi:hypothetical protein